MAGNLACSGVFDHGSLPHGFLELIYDFLKKSPLLAKYFVLYARDDLPLVRSDRVCYLFFPGLLHKWPVYVQIVPRGRPK